MDRFVQRLGVVVWTGSLLVLGGCGDSTGTAAGGQPVSLNFRVIGVGGSAPAAAGGQASVAAVAPRLVAGPPMVLEGNNGTLTLDEIRIIINEVELHRADGACPSGADSGEDSATGQDAASSDGMEDFDDDCGEFEVGPRFLDLPLDGVPIEAVTALIPAGAYKELDFEIEDLEDDEDASEAALIAEVRQEIRSEFPDWPDEASAMVAGSFAPTAGGTIDFRVFLAAEIEIEFELVPNLVVADDGSSNRDLTVDVSPQSWFSNPDGSLVPLHLYDYDTTGQLLEFEVEMEHGFTEIERDD